MGPVMALLVFNLVIFVIVVIVLVKHSRKRTRATREKSVKVTIQTLISIIGIVFLFGLTWLFGAFTATQKSQLPFLILFVVFSSFQGFFVFLFFCVFNGETRQVWVQFLTRGRHGKRIIYQQKAVKSSKATISHGTLSTNLKRSSQQYTNPLSATTQESSSFIPDEYDMQEMQIEIYHTTEEEMYLKEGALDTDTSLTVRPTSPVHGFITCSAAENQVISNPGADQDTDASLPVHLTSPVHGDNITFSAAEDRVACAHQDKP